MNWDSRLQSELHAHLRMCTWADKWRGSSSRRARGGCNIGTGPPSRTCVYECVGLCACLCMHVCVHVHALKCTCGVSSSEIILRVLDPRSVFRRLLGMHEQVRHTWTASAYCRVGGTFCSLQACAAVGSGMRKQHKEPGRAEEEDRRVVFSSRPVTQGAQSYPPLCQRPMARLQAA